ncbi:MAG TPA: RluA family pseudouridine synthase [Tissierellaceae bacterium]|nr:RluA family pseudouridine synthase [Tissierellaceae bacterium]
MNTFHIKVKDDNKERLDSFVAENLEKVSRSYVKKIIGEKLVFVNGKLMKPSYIVKKGDLIEINIPEVKKIKAIPENIPLDVIYEDKDIVIVNKPQGMVVHPGVDNTSGTLVNSLLYHIETLSDINKDIRPGIVHRIDKDTSGILVVAKNNKTHKFLSSQFKTRKVKRVYLVLVHGIVEKDKGKIEAAIGRNKNNRMKMNIKDDNGRDAISYFKVLHRFNKYTLLEVSLETGRTHQIRVHMKHLKHPVVGDPLYSDKKNNFSLKKQMLHAYKLGFIHPSKKEYVEFTANPPNYFSKIIDKLKRINNIT